MKKQLFKTISTTMGQVNRYKCYNNKYNYFFLWVWSIKVFLSTTMVFFISFNMDKGVADLEMSSSIKLQRIKKSHKNCPVLSIKCTKHNYELVSGIKSKLLHGYF